MIPAPTDAAPPEAATMPGDAVPAVEAEATMSGADSNDLLASLITAMREVADHERETSLAGLRGSVDLAIEMLRQRAEVGAEDLRRKADGEITGFGEWVKVEIERITAEGDRKIEARRQQLSQQLTDHEQRSQHEIESLHARFDEYERELASFFAQLHEIDDPAAFGAAAKRMPRPPALAGQAAPPAVTATATTAPTETPGQTTAPTETPGQTTAEPAPPASASAPVAAEPPVPQASEPPVAPEASEPAAPKAPEAPEAPSATDDAEARLVEEHRTRLDALGLTRADAPNAVTEPGPADHDAAPDDGAMSTADAGTAAGAADDQYPLRARLAELDAAIGPEENHETATSTQSRGGDVATAIVVHGLGSFGAITSFKQALERVDGVHGISLALGPTGEFVYRATHETDFDLVAAIEQIERGGAQIDRQADGSLRVTVQRSSR